MFAGGACEAVLNWFERTLLIVSAHTYQQYLGVSFAAMKNSELADRISRLISKADLGIQKVEAGDVLFVLGNGDSAEIETLTDQIRQLRLSYQQTAVGATNYGGQLQKAQTRYNNAVAAEAAALAQLNSNPDFQSALTALESSKTELASAELNYKLANETALQSLDSLASSFSDFSLEAEKCGADATSMTTLNDARFALNNAREALTSADGSVNSVSVALTKLETADNAIMQFALQNPDLFVADPDLGVKYDALAPYFDMANSYLSDEARNNDVMDTIGALQKAIERNTSAQNLYDGFSSMFTDSYNAAVAERQAAEAALGKHTGKDTAGEFSLYDGIGCEIVASNLTLNTSSTLENAAYTAFKSAALFSTLHFKGENSLTGCTNRPAIYVPEGSTLWIFGKSQEPGNFT